MFQEGEIIMKTWNRKELKDKAKLRLKTNYWKAVLIGLLTILIGGASPTTTYTLNDQTTTAVTTDQVAVAGAAGSALEEIAKIPVAGWIAIAVFMLIFVLIVMAIVFLVKALVFNPLEIGRDRFFYKDLEEDAEIKEVCFAFDRGYKNSVKVMFFRDLYTILWTLLFIIPGIVKAYEYRMIPYILSEDPNMDKNEVFAMSKQMMTGNKWKAFVLDLSFILWDILGACTCGILHIFYIEPYKRLTDAGLYQALKDEQLGNKEQIVITEQ